MTGRAVARAGRLFWAGRLLLVGKMNLLPAHQEEERLEIKEELPGAER